MPGGATRPLIWLGMLYLNMYTVQAGFEKICSGWESPDPGGICGDLIPETLHLLCMGAYNVPYKREAEYHNQYIGNV